MECNKLHGFYMVLVFWIYVHIVCLEKSVQLLPDGVITINSQKIKSKWIPSGEFCAQNDLGVGEINSKKKIDRTIF